MPHLGVAHVLIRGQSHRVTVGFELGMGIILQEIAEIRRFRVKNRIAGSLVAQADAVHHNQNYRLFHKTDSFIIG